MSANGRYVAFSSDATNLVTGDSNGLRDVFRLDTQTGEIVLVSVSTAGVQASILCDNPSISGDGRYVAFESSASNLVSGDTGFHGDVFLRDVTLSTTVRVSVSDGAGVQGNGFSSSAMVSADGSCVAFSSSATNLVGSDTNGQSDVFVRNPSAGTTIRASVATGGGQATGGGAFGPSISSDGSVVAFTSTAANLVSGDTNAQSDVFVRTIAADTTVRANVATGGAQATGSFSSLGGVSGDGKRVVFTSGATNLVAADTNFRVDVFVHDLATTSTKLASVASGFAQIQADENCASPSINYDGTVVAFHTASTNLVPGDANGALDVFVHDLAGITTRASVDTAGGDTNGTSLNSSLSSDGTRVAFYSNANDLVAGDSNGFSDVFVRDLATKVTSLPVTLSEFNLD